MQDTSELTLENVKAKVREGESLPVIASSFGTTVYEVRRLLKQAGLTYRSLKPTIVSQVKSRITEWSNLGYSISKAAEEIGVSSSYLRTVLSTQGLSLNPDHKPKVAKPSSKVEALTEEALGMLLVEGGSIKSICERIGASKYAVQIRKNIVSKGIDPQHYYFAHRRFGKWLTLPGPVIKTASGDKKIPCRCLGCGTEHLVSYSNLVSAKSTCCKACRQPDPMSVVVKETGEVFPSIYAAAKSLDVLDLYQNIRYHLQKNHSYETGSHTLLLNN